MKLTIGMIVKNEEQLLEKCLNSIKPILDSVDSELIITDTGSTDGTLEIAARFTDKIQHFDWINDFSAARNTTIDTARGDWYMFVDGDDIFESCDDIINFFNSGEYKKFHCASFRYRNILNLEKRTFVDQNVIRMTERSPETKFIGRIHENLSPLNTPVRMITDIVDHYGYLYDENNPEEEKMRRNEELLLKELEEISESDTKHPFIYYYLFETLRNLDPAKAEQYLNLGMEEARKNNSDALIPMYIDKVGVFFKRSDYESLIKLCDDYFSINNTQKKHSTADAEMYAAKALSLSNLGREEEAYPVYECFFTSFNEMKKNDISDAEIFVSSPVLAGDTNFLNIVMKFIGCCVSEKRTDELLSFLAATDLAPYSFNNTTVSYIVENEIALLSSNGYKYASKLYNNHGDHGKKVFTNSLCNVLFVDRNKSEIIDALTSVVTGNSPLEEKLAIYRAYFIEKQIDENEISGFAHKFGMDGNHDLLCIMMQCGMDISRLFDIPDFDPMICIKRCCDYIYGFYDAAAGYKAEYISENNALPLTAKLFEYCMKGAIEIGHPINDLFEVYIQIGSHYVLPPDNNIAPVEISAARMLYNAQIMCNTKRFKDCFSKIKETVVLYPNITPVAIKFQEIVSEEYNKSLKTIKLSPEMHELSVKLKNNIRNMIMNGDTEGAKKFLDEYEKINPDDPETATLRNLI